MRRKSERTMLEWYRVDRTERIRHVLVRASSLVLLGSLMGAYAALGMRITHGVPMRARLAGPFVDVLGAPLGVPWPERTLGVLALLSVIVGAATAIRGLARELRDERWLALRTDALVVARDGKTVRIRWKHIDDVRVDGTTIVVTLRSGRAIEIRERFAGTTRTALGEKIAQARRRALHGLL